MNCLLFKTPSCTAREIPALWRVVRGEPQALVQRSSFAPLWTPPFPNSPPTSGLSCPAGRGRDRGHSRAGRHPLVQLPGDERLPAGAALPGGRLRPEEVEAILEGRSGPAAGGAGPRRKINLVIDIQRRMAQGKGRDMSIGPSSTI